jgi:hypothetical protein
MHGSRTKKVLRIWLHQLKLKARATGLVITPQSVLHIARFCISFFCAQRLGIWFSFRRYVIDTRVCVSCVHFYPFTMLCFGR